MKIYDKKLAYPYFVWMTLFTVVPLIIVVVLFATMIISSPWLVLSVSTGLYALSIPVGVLFFLKAKRKAERRI